MEWNPLLLRNAIDTINKQSMARAQREYVQQQFPEMDFGDKPDEIVSAMVKNIFKSQNIDMSKVTKNSDGTYSPVLTAEGAKLLALANERNMTEDEFQEYILGVVGSGGIPKDKASGQTLFLSSALADADYMTTQRINLERKRLEAETKAKAQKLKSEMATDKALNNQRYQEIKNQLDAVNTAKTQLIDGVPNLVTLGVTAAAPVGVVSLFGSDQEPAPYLPKYPPPPQNPYYRGSYY